MTEQAAGSRVVEHSPEHWDMYVLGRFTRIFGYFAEDRKVGITDYLVVEGVLDLSTGEWWTADQYDWLFSSVEPMRSIELSCLEIEEQLFWLNMPHMATDKVRNELLG